MATPHAAIPTTKPIRALFFGTSPAQFNGYSVVTYHLAKMMATRPDEVDWTVFGFQNFYKHDAHAAERSLPATVHVHDAFACEAPKEAGFGFNHVKEFVVMHRPDVCIVYNDSAVIRAVLGRLASAPNRKSFKIIVYWDQVYANQHREYVALVNQHCDAAIFFTAYWERMVRAQGLRIPTYSLPHGFDPDTYYPVPKHLARMYFGLPQGAWIVFNNCRNQPRKRWDHTIMAFVELISRHRGEPIKLMIGTDVTGAWDLLELYERELSKHSMTMQEGMDHLIVLSQPQMLTDEDINFLTCASDVCLNTCDGEGFGLTTFIAGGVGVPCVVSKLGGHLDFFDDACALLVPPCISYYVEATRDTVGGEAQMCQPSAFADALDRYYTDPQLAEEHGRVARQRIAGAQRYRWSDIADKLLGILVSTVRAEVVPACEPRLASIAEEDAPVCAAEQDEGACIDDSGHTVSSADAVCASACPMRSKRRGCRISGKRMKRKAHDRNMAAAIDDLQARLADLLMQRRDLA